MRVVIANPTILLLPLVLVVTTSTVVAGGAFIDPPMLSARVARGLLPRVEERIPKVPMVVTLVAPQRSPGRHGGELRLLMARSKDVRLMVVYGYTRLAIYNERFQIEPDILKDIDVEGDRIFTLSLRDGHKWSDGNAFTAEDFRYYWEDIANNRELSPVGPPSVFLVDGEPPRFEVLDETTVRYRWEKPNPFFLAALAGARPQYIYAPAHYLRQFHAKYHDAAELSASAQRLSLRSWAALHNRMYSPYKNSNPDLPTLQPWFNTTRAPSERFIFERNPYYHRVDQRGQQLPYIDRVVMTIVDSRLIPAKSAAGESDLQARYLHISDYAFLKASEQRTNTAVRLWEMSKGSHIALFPNLNASDEVWRRLLRDVRFRRALSLAIDRTEINQVIYYGMATEGNNTLHASSPLFRPAYRTVWTQYDPVAANTMLDDLGLGARNEAGIRLLPDGRPAVIIVETAGEDTEQSDVLELIHDSWQRVGIKLFIKPLQREVFRNRVFSGRTLMSVWGGWENGVPTAEMSPRELAPTSQHQLQWPKWGQFFETGGTTGEPVDLDEARELRRLNRNWQSAEDTASRQAIWQRMLEIHADQVFIIGLVANVPQPVLVSQTLRNVPEKAVYNWAPGAHFGLYKPDTFWFTDIGRRASGH